jgi:hypothetical protein
MAHKIDQNKVERIETPYGNGYAYGGRIYSDKQWKDILDFNAGGSIVPGGYSDKTGTYDGFANKMIAGPEGEIQTENQYRNAINYGDAWNSDKPWGTKTPEQAQYFKDMNASATRNKVIDSDGNIINPKGFKRGGRALAAQEEAAWNKEMGIDDASVRADEAAINASKDALEQSYSDKNDAAEDDRIARYSSASNESDARDARMEEGRYLAARNQARREANPVSEQVSRGTGVAKGAFDETGDAENAPVSLINNQTTYKKPVKKEKEVIDYSNVTDDKDSGITPTNPGRKNPNYSNNLQSNLDANPNYSDQSTKWLNDTELERRTKLNEKSRELDKLWKDYTKSHPGITSRQWYNSSVGGTADLKSGEYVQDPIVLERNKKYQKDHPEEYKSYTWNPQFRKGESVLGSSSFSKPFTGDK